MKREFIVERQGKSFVLYAGLLDEAHQHGLKAIRTSLIQAPTAENGHVAIVSAEIEVERGTFSGLGDASPDNVSRMMLPHLLRMAETRAKARALRDAVNVGVASLEEMVDDEPSPRPAETPVENTVAAWSREFAAAPDLPVLRAVWQRAIEANRHGDISGDDFNKIQSLKDARKKALDGLDPARKAASRG